MEVTFDGYTLTFWLLTTGNRYEPAEFAFTETPDGLVALMGSQVLNTAVTDAAASSRRDDMTRLLLCQVDRFGEALPNGTVPPFTCRPLRMVAQAKYDMGVLAFEMLREQTEDGGLPPRRELLETELVIESPCCASPPG